MFPAADCIAIAYHLQREGMYLITIEWKNKQERNP